MPRRLRRDRPASSTGKDDDDFENSFSRRRKMYCRSCLEPYCITDAGNCRECYFETDEKKDKLEMENDELKSKVNFLRLLCAAPDSVTRENTPSFSDVVLVASGSPDSCDVPCNWPPIPAHRVVLTSRSPVFRAMLETEMKESLSGTIKMNDVSYNVLRAFVNYLYTAEACLDEQMACDLLVLAEKYQVKHLKTHCEKHLISRLNWENSLPYCALAHQQAANTLLDASTSLIHKNMDKLKTRGDYLELVKRDPHIIFGIYESYVAKEASKDPDSP